MQRLVLKEEKKNVSVYWCSTCLSNEGGKKEFEWKMERTICWKVVNSKNSSRTSFRCESNVAQNDTGLTFNSIDRDLQSTYVHACSFVYAFLFFYTRERKLFLKLFEEEYRSPFFFFSVQFLLRWFFYCRIIISAFAFLFSLSTL